MWRWSLPLTAAVAALILLNGCATWCACRAPLDLPAPTGAALWAKLQAAEYQEWPMWPGKQALYEGNEPHGMLLTTYINGPAKKAIKKGTRPLPEGAAVVKENYKPDKTLAAITVMVKKPGYNPEAGDWFWAKYAPDGTVQKEGKVGGCIECHGAGKANDYLLTGMDHSGH